MQFCPCFQITMRRRLRLRPSTTTPLRWASARQRPCHRGCARPTWMQISNPTQNRPFCEEMNTFSGYGIMLRRFLSNLHHLIIQFMFLQKKVIHPKNTKMLFCSALTSFFSFSCDWNINFFCKETIHQGKKVNLTYFFNNFAWKKKNCDLKKNFFSSFWKKINFLNVRKKYDMGKQKKIQFWNFFATLLNYKFESFDVNFWTKIFDGMWKYDS